MAYNHYRYTPGWGTQQFQLGAPPLPTYQPLPTWSGLDFYSAHAMGGDPLYYQNAISRLSSGFGGLGSHEAKMWHRRAYAGWGEVTRMMPMEIGAAAAYEAYRQIKYGHNVYSFLYSDFERQREALRALAVAEAFRLWQDTGRAVDQYGLQAACDAAAGTASNIITERQLEDPYGMGGMGMGGMGMGGMGMGGMGMGGMGMGGMGYGGYRSRRNSFAAFPMSGGYASSAGLAGLGGGSVYGGGSAYGGGSVYGGDSPILGGRSIPGSPIGAGPIPIAGSSMGGMGGVPYAGSHLGVGMPMSYGGGYAGSYGSPGYDPLGGGYPMSAMGGYASLPGTPATMLIAPPEDDHHRGHRHRHRHHHRHHRRHRSHDRY